MASGGFPTGQIWRSAIAGEDGAYRTGICANWRASQCSHPALIHRAKEGGATVFFLDRSVVQEGRVVITQLHAIETSGELHGAYSEFWKWAERNAQEIRACLRSADSVD